MIRVILNGGLGNQMFQYATAKAVALKHQVPLYLDTGFLQTRIPFKEYTPLKGFTYRDYELDLFNVPDEKGALFGVPVLDRYFSYALTLGYNKIINSKNYFSDKDNVYVFHPAIFDMGSDLVLDGSFNNYKYFEAYEQEIRAVFDMQKLYDPEFEGFEQKVKSTPSSVALHLRRGDYLNVKHQNVYVGLTEKYYKSAVDYIKSKLNNPHFFLFTQDEPEWFEANLSIEKGTYTVVPQEVSGVRNRTHFRLMSLAQHNIIANSTYSWWAAYLNKNPDKICISPSKWMTMHKFENMPSWIEIESA